jgi:hypothetical protein
MKIIKSQINFVSYLIIAFLFANCSTVDEDCLCTEEFRTYLVTVIDTLGAPVDSLNITIKDKDGDELDVKQEPYYLGEGKYTVLNDSFTHIMCACGTPQVIDFSATDGSRTANCEFSFNTDKCRCHITKISGPDTLVLR